MKINIFFLPMLIALIFCTTLYAQDSSKVKNKNRIKTKENVEKQNIKKHGIGFVDNDGDGYNDNAPDHDGDGIPNGLDEDYHRKGKKRFIDLNGDGINDNVGSGRMGKNKLMNPKHSNKKGFESHGGNVNGVTNNHEGGMMDKTGKTRKGKNGHGGH